MSLFDPQTPRRFKNETPVFQAPIPRLRLPPRPARPLRAFCFLQAQPHASLPSAPLSPSHLPHFSFSCPAAYASCMSHAPHPFTRWLIGQPAPGYRTPEAGAPALWPQRRSGSEVWSDQAPRSLSPLLLTPDPHSITLKLTLSPSPEPSKVQGVLCMPFGLCGGRKRPPSA